MSDYRNKLVSQIKATGEYITEHAEEMVDTADLKINFSLRVNFEQHEYPEIEITQKHAMKNVIKVIDEEKEKRQKEHEKECNKKFMEFIKSRS